MLFKGTHRRPTGLDISKAIEGLGGYVNAATDKEITQYWTRVARPHFTEALDVLADLFLHSRFDPVEIDRERLVIVEEIISLFDSPASWVHQIMAELLYGDHPLGRDIVGTPESVSAIGRKEMLAYIATQYVPNNLVVAVAGNLSHEEAVAATCSHFGDLTPGTVLPCEPAPDGQTTLQLRVQFKETEQANLCLSVPALDYRHPDRYALKVLNVILGEGMSSRLFQEVREVRGLAYAVGSYLSSYRDVGSMVAFASVDLGRVPNTVRVILDEWHKIAHATRPVSDEELARAKEYTKGRFLLGLEESRSVAAWIGIQEIRDEEILTPEQAVARMEAVTRDDVQRLAAQFFKPEKLNLAIIGPYEDEESFRSLLTF
jgi:predicted Zn-dependent peptidase